MSREEIELSAKDKMRIAGLLADIQALAILINEFTKMCVFVRMSGHVRDIEVQIAASKEKYLDKTVEAQVSYNPYYYKRPEDMLAKLNKLKYQLKKILREQKIDYSGLPYEIEEVRHYKLV